MAHACADIERALHAQSQLPESMLDDWAPSSHRETVLVFLSVVFLTCNCCAILCSSEAWACSSTTWLAYDFFHFMESPTMRLTVGVVLPFLAWLWQALRGNKRAARRTVLMPSLVGIACKALKANSVSQQCTVNATADSKSGHHRPRR